MELCSASPKGPLLVEARKAFDSVDHEYMLEVLKVLKVYGFGPKFINWVKLLNKNLMADILVNGFRTDKIDIEMLITVSCII